MTLRAALAAVALGGCGFPAEDFAVEMGDATCQLYSDCALYDVFGFDSDAACVDTVFAAYDPETVECPDYDGRAARDCVDGVLQMTCEDVSAGAWPDACASRCG